MTYFSYGQVLKTNYNNLYQKSMRYTPPLSLILTTQKPKYIFRRNNSKNIYRKTFNSTIRKRNQPAILSPSKIRAP